MRLFITRRAALAIALLPSLAAASVDPVVDIHSPGDVEAKRAALVQYIWGTSWSDVLSRQPAATHDNYIPVSDDALPQVSNLDRIEQIVVNMGVPAASGNTTISHTSNAYLFHPRTPNGHVVVVHHGHDCAFDGSDKPYNLDKTIQDLMANNFAVLALRMPYFQTPSHCGGTGDHNNMFTDDSQRLRTGSPLQFFLEPIAESINYIQRKYAVVYYDFNLVGVSGGGWTTTVYAAIDPRIVLSFPVAGSLPLDVDGARSRDMEQYESGFYNIAGYRDLYVLGSFGANRVQTQILNVHDSCCFTPNPQDAAAYTAQVQTTLSQLGSGAFVFHYDETSTTHQISVAAISRWILPTLHLGPPPPPPTVTFVDPPTVPVGTDSSIEITGTNFINVRGVFPASDFQLDPSGTTIRAHILSDAWAGCYNIEVRTDHGNSSPSNTSKFCVTPIVKNINPAGGPFTGGTQVSVTGAGFAVPAPGVPTSASFLVGGNSAGVEPCSETNCTIFTPPGNPGDAPLRACIQGACSTTPATFHYTGPTTTSFSPSHGPLTGGTWVEINGTSLVHDGRVQVFFGDAQALQSQGCSPIFFSDTCIRAQSPQHSAGQVPITARASGSSVAAPGIFTYDPQGALTEFGYDQGRVTDPGWVALNGFAPPDGAFVSIASTDPAAVPATSVKVVAGSSAANFTLTFLPVPRAETVTLTASYAGSSLRTSVDAIVEPQPPRPSPLSIGLDADQLANGDSAIATVALNPPAGPAGAIVALSSSDPTAVPVPAPPTVAIQPGSTTGTFRITNNYSGRPKKVTITATYGGLSASASLYVPKAPTGDDCTHCRTPEQCCVCNGGVWDRGKCQ